MDDPVYDDQPGHEMDRHIGKCHLCEREHLRVTFCSMCKHWMCRQCRDRWFARSIAAIEEAIGGSRPGCCYGEEIK